MAKYIAEVKITLLIDSEHDLATISEGLEFNQLYVSFDHGKIVRSTVTDYQVLQPS